MSKKHKNIPSARQNNSAKPAVTGLVTRLTATHKSAQAALTAQSWAWDEKELLALLEALTPEQHSRFAAVFESQICALGSAMHKAHEVATKREAEASAKILELEQQASEQRTLLEGEQASLSQEREALRMMREEFERLQASLRPREIEVEQRERGLEREQIRLSEQEDRLRQGLVQDEIAMLRGVKEQLTKLREERDNLALMIEEERTRLMEVARQDAAVIRAQGNELKAHWEHLIQEVSSKEAELEKSRSVLTERERRLQARRNALEEEVQQRVEEAISASSAESSRVKDELNDALKEIDRLESVLRSTQEMQRRSGGDPARLMEEVRELRQRLEQRDEEVQQLRMSLERGDPVALKKRVVELEDHLDKKQGALRLLEAEKHRWEQFVLERQSWQQTRLVMESSKRLLDEQVKQLQSQVNDLTNQQQAASVFPELARMDRDFTVAVHTDQLADLKSFAIELRGAMSHAGERGVFKFREEDIQLFIGGLAMSQLHILQGISGTGKTSLATAFAKAIGAELTVIAVQAGWRERADLLGYFNAFDRKFYENKTLQAIYRAQTEQDQDRLHVVLLDEMNLSRPEQYFADFLSAMEGEGAVRNIRLIDSRMENAPRALVDGRDLFLPRNVWFIGTANQDETTNGFADKTHDRAFVMEVHRPGENIPDAKRPTRTKTLSVSSLLTAFDQVEQQAQARMEAQIAVLNKSSLAKTLERDFQTGWGSRLERQWRRFVPVVVASGGAEEMAIDHLLQTRVIRDGKVTGRHNTNEEKLTKVAEDLRELWLDLNFQGEPSRCLEALEKDQRRLEQGG